MKTADDFRCALGEGDEGFHRRVQATLAALPEEEPVVKRKMSVGLAIAFALLMMTMVAAVAANWWGIGDFLKNDNIEGMTQELGVTAETEHATFTVTEHIYDGRGLYMVVAVRPKKANILLQPSGNSTFLMGDGKALGLDEMEEYTGGLGRTRKIWVQLDAELNGERLFYTINRANLEKDGTMTLMLFALIDGKPEELLLSVTCGTHTADTFHGTKPWQDDARISKDKTTMILPLNTLEEQKWRSETPVIFDQIGVTVEEVRVINTPLIAYFEIDYIAHDPASKHYWFRFVNEDGSLRRPKSVIEPHTVLPMRDSKTGRGYLYGIMTLEDELPGNVYVKGYLGNLNSPDAVQILSIPLIPAE